MNYKKCKGNRRDVNTLVITILFVVGMSLLMSIVSMVFLLQGIRAQ